MKPGGYNTERAFHSSLKAQAKKITWKKNYKRLKRTTKDLNETANS
jgi:hypothetical protein